MRVPAGGKRRIGLPLVALTVLSALLAPAPGLASNPRTEYMLDCMGCHQADGSGVPGKVPDMRLTLGPFSRTAAGRRYLIEVPGVAQAPLSNADLAELLNWLVRNLGETSQSQHFVPFTAEEVAAYRSTPLVEVTAVRRRLLTEAGRHMPVAQ